MAHLAATSRTGFPVSRKQKCSRKKKKLQNQKQGFYFWLKVSHYCKTFPIPQPGNDLQIIFLLALQKKGEEIDERSQVVPRIYPVYAEIQKAS